MQLLAGWCSTQSHLVRYARITLRSSHCRHYRHLCQRFTGWVMVRRQAMTLQCLVYLTCLIFLLGLTLLIVTFHRQRTSRLLIDGRPAYRNCKLSVCIFWISSSRLELYRAAQSPKYLLPNLAFTVCLHIGSFESQVAAHRLSIKHDRYRCGQTTKALQKFP